VLNATGKLHNVRGRYTDARAALDSALTLATHFSNQEGQARALMHLGVTYVGVGENERALDISTNIRQRELSKDLYAHLSELYLQKGDHQRALALYKQYDSLQDTRFTDRATRRFTEMRTRYHSERKERENIALRHESGQQQVTIDRQQLVSVLGSFVLLLVLASLALLYRTQRSTARHNYQLGEVNQTLEENNARLEQALDQVQTLSCLIPICANCKNIRDDEGYWERLETYLLKRSDAQFTHSICPNCVRELYPDYADEINPDPPES
jgi:tetratricopeptide (TPR) repeat protein